MYLAQGNGELGLLTLRLALRDLSVLAVPVLLRPRPPVGEGVRPAPSPRSAGPLRRRALLGGQDRGAPRATSGARVSLRRSFTSAAVTITTAARASWRRLGARGGGGGGWSSAAGGDRPPRERPAHSALRGAPFHALAGGKAPRTSPQRLSPRAGTKPASESPSRRAAGQAEPLSARARSPDSMAPGERAGATTPPTTNRNPKSSRRKEGAPGAAGPDPGARPRPPPPPQAMAGR